MNCLATAVKFNLHHLRKNGFKLLTVAALVIVLEANGLLTVPLQLSLLALNNVSANAEPTRMFDLSRLQTAVIAIDTLDYQGRYGGKSPLNRCLLAKDFADIQERHPAATVIDLDLSPLPHPDAKDLACQRELDSALDHARTRVVLLYPADGDKALTDPVTLDWARQRCEAGATFGSAKLHLMFGTVTEMQENGRHGIAYMARHPEDREICNIIGSSRSAAELQQHLAPILHVVPETPINFIAAAGFVPPQLTLAQFKSFTAIPAGITLFWGGTWGHDDEYLTPLGHQQGVMIHAAEWISLTHRARESSHLLAFMLDVSMAYLFSIVIDCFWKLYAQCKLLEAEAEPKLNPLPACLSALVYVAFVATYLMVCWTLMVAASKLYKDCGIITAPLLIMACLLIDGFMSGPVDVLIERMQEKPKIARPSSADTPTADGASLANELRPQGLWAATILCAALVIAGLSTGSMFGPPGRPLLMTMAVLTAIIGLLLICRRLIAKGLGCFDQGIIYVVGKIKGIFDLIGKSKFITCVIIKFMGRRTATAELDKTNTFISTALLIGRCANYLRMLFISGILIYAFYLFFR